MRDEDIQNFGIDPVKDSCRKPWAFASTMLQRVSRTFALNIQVLPRFRLRRPVLLAYLYCRMADTIEDCPEMSAETKGRLLAMFAKIFQGPAERRIDLAQAFSCALPSGWSSSEDDNEYLCAHCHWTAVLFDEMPSTVRVPLAKCIQEMCGGMANFAQRQESLQGQWLTIENEQDLDRYCYYVAGVVGNMLSDMFYGRSPWIGKERGQKMRALAVSFGLALQITNIIKDMGEDSERQVCFVPLEWIRGVGFSNPQDMFAAADSDSRNQIVRLMIQKAWRHLEDAMRFTLLIPAMEPRLRLFCLWPMLMAAENLLAFGDGHLVFSSSKVKISRESVKRILRQTTLRFWDSSWLEGRLHSLRQMSL